jgi:hypothetical protein
VLGEVNGKARERERDHNGRGQRYRSAVYARAFATEHTTGHNGRSNGVQFSGSSPPSGPKPRPSMCRIFSTSIMGSKRCFAPTTNLSPRAPVIPRIQSDAWRRGSSRRRNVRRRIWPAAPYEESRWCTTGVKKTKRYTGFLYLLAFYLQSTTFCKVGDALSNQRPPPCKGG